MRTNVLNQIYKSKQIYSLPLIENYLCAIARLSFSLRKLFWPNSVFGGIVWSECVLKVLKKLFFLTQHFVQGD